MSIQNEIDRINQNIADTYSVLNEAGAETPTTANSENLADTAASISAVLYNKDQGLSDTQKEQARSNIGALAESELDNAVNDALSQAKESGEFDGAPGADGSPGAAGKDGTSVTVTNVSESTADGGTNVVTFSDGKKLNVKNGSKGADGSPGATGPAGAGVKSMAYNRSTNQWTVLLTDNTSILVDGPAIPDVSAYMPKSGGTFTGAVKAAAANTSGYYVRNIKFSATAETPTTEGDICFKLA